MTELARSSKQTADWYRALSADDRRTLVATCLGYTLDAMDFLFLALVITLIVPALHITLAMAALLSSTSLFASAFGGWLFGVLTDYMGRARVMMITVLVFSVASLGAATSQTWTQLLLWRVLLGLGMGGEWGAGQALLLEKWGTGSRGKGSAFLMAMWPVGYFLAVAASAVIVPLFGWRGLFAFGVVPALLVFWIRRSIPEPEIWQRARDTERIRPAEIFSPSRLGQTALMVVLAIAGQWAYQSFATWMPTFLQGAVTTGGLGLPFQRSLHYLFLLNGVGIVAYVAFGYLSDTLGRRLPTALFAALTGVFGLLTVYGGGDPFLRAIGIAGVGAFLGYFCVYGAWISELYPTRVRGWALGFIFNSGRVVGGLAPIVIGKLAPSLGLGKAMLIGEPALLVVVALAWLVRETLGAPLT